MMAYGLPQKRKRFVKIFMKENRPKEDDIV